MAETSNRRADAVAFEASEKRECGVVETNSSAARVRELLGPAIAARLQRALAADTHNTAQEVTSTTCARKLFPWLSALGH